jgi:hypothetical protein
MSPRQRRGSNLIFVSEVMSDLWALDIALFASSTGFVWICSVSVSAVEGATSVTQPPVRGNSWYGCYITPALRSD